MRERGGGVLISLEGCDGCGKSTQAALLCERLAACGLPVGPATAPGSVIREPGATPAGEAIRSVLLHGPSSLAPWTETLLYAAARAELVETVLLPELEAGRVLVLDRFVDSSLAYQGFARGLGYENLLTLNMWATEALMPDLTLVLLVDAAVRAARMTGALDRVESAGDDFFTRVDEGYRHLLAEHPHRIRAVEARGSVADVAARVIALVGDELGLALAEPDVGPA
jgi:dTMP kinase